MPGHRRVKGLEVDDDYDDFASDEGDLNGQGEELSPEDQGLYYSVALNIAAWTALSRDI